MNPHRFKAYLYLLAAGIIWGVAGPVIKVTLGVIEPSAFLLYRFFLSVLIAAPALIKSRHYFKKTGFLFPLSVYAFLNSTACLGFLFWGADKTSLLDMSLISLIGPMLMMLLGLKLLKENITKKERIGAVIAVAGSLVIALEPLAANSHGQNRLVGNLLIFLSLVCGTYATFLAKKLLREGFPAFFLTNISFLVGFITLIPFALLKTTPLTLTASFAGLPLTGHLGVIYMALFSGTIAYTLNNLGQKTIELSEAALFNYLHPVISAVIALIVLGDKLTVPIVIGGLVVTLGVAIAEVKRRKT